MIRYVALSAKATNYTKKVIKASACAKNKTISSTQTEYFALEWLFGCVAIHGQSQITEIASAPQ